MRPHHFVSLLLFVPMVVFGQREDLLQGLDLTAEAQLSVSGGNTPLWLNANKYGLSSLEEGNGYMRVSAIRPESKDCERKWRWGYGLDVAVAANYTSTLIVQQAFAELGWRHGVLTIGSKQVPMELKNSRLSSGSQALGVNARPVPQVRLALPGYWTLPVLNRWLHFKGHVAYGLYTDSGWQKDFTNGTQQYVRNTLYHSKAGYLKIQNRDHLYQLSLELGLEMAAQFGGTLYAPDGEGGYTKMKNGTGLSSYWHAFVGGGQDERDGDYPNVEGNHLGAWMARLNYDEDLWGASLYFEHFFEDLSGMALIDYDGYGEGDEWNTKVDSRYYRFPLKDFMVGAEVRLPYWNWINGIVFEYLHTKYQSGPFNHDRTKNISDHQAGQDNYYNHSIYNAWQHWGQVIGNPLYRSPIYNDDGTISVLNNRFKALHLGVEGQPTERLSYRVLATYQVGWGTYAYPYTKKEHNISAMLEASCLLRNGWRATAAFGLDSGKILGDNQGFQLTVAKKLSIEK